ncbi:hypothetical protein POM88_009687 [Heracleum sosnowskyi]|uniref:Uncharacterized protein n=1 Tax=Heracleum sosnowskyi TaxID=360622 RepID=A0AAD8JAE0_9APIA|nr:hypothetical protein POM88_009687 [Heracleum sosnowskyi]
MGFTIDLSFEAWFEDLGLFCGFGACSDFNFSLTIENRIHTEAAGKNSSASQDFNQNWLLAMTTVVIVFAGAGYIGPSMNPAIPNNLEKIPKLEQSEFQSWSKVKTPSHKKRVVYLMLYLLNSFQNLKQSTMRLEKHGLDPNVEIVPKCSTTANGIKSLE